MLREVLTLGDKIDIKPLDKTGKPLQIARTFASQLVDLVDFDVINIAVPIVHGKIMILEVGNYYNLCFYSNKGLYQCNCVVLSNHKENKMTIAVVRITTNLEKYQRRQYYRLECIHVMVYRVYTREEEILENKFKLNDFQNEVEHDECKKRLSQLEKEWIKGSITDISGGGARFNSEVLHNQGVKLRIKLEIVIGNDKKNMILQADIIASGSIMNRNDIYEHRVEFNDITQRDRENLIKYIFEQDRRRRRNDKER